MAQSPLACLIAASDSRAPAASASPLNHQKRCEEEVFRHRGRSRPRARDASASFIFFFIFALRGSWSVFGRAPRASESSLSGASSSSSSTRDQTREFHPTEEQTSRMSRSDDCEGIGRARLSACFAGARDDRHGG
jgi:hypothetical protein